MPSRTLYVFLWSLLPLLFHPEWRLLFFAPFFIVTFYKKSRNFALWATFGCGLGMDLLASTPFGLLTLSYVLTTFILYNQKRHFFEDRLSTPPVMAFLFSFLSTSLLAASLAFSGHPFSVSWHWVKGNLLLAPLYDALYALLWAAPLFQITRRLSRIPLYAAFRNRRKRRRARTPSL